jgi:hypothetical protein
VHFEVLKNGRQIDPLSFIGARPELSRISGPRSPAMRRRVLARRPIGHTQEPSETSTVRSGLSVEYRPGCASHCRKWLSSLKFLARIL